MRKFITYFFLIISSLIVIVAFVTATTYVQLVLASMFYALIVYFLLRTFPRDIDFVHVPAPVATQATAIPAGATSNLPDNNLPVADNNKRDLLKMVGAAGLSFFLFSLFNRRPGGSFFGGAPNLPLGTTGIEDTAGQKIDPAKSQPTDGYRISEIDDSIISYYGFINQEGSWFIMKEDADSGSFRYVKGSTDFPGNWESRENLTYDYYYKVF